MVTADARNELVLVSLYPAEMNIYGDQGNVRALTRRIRQFGFIPRVIELNIGDDMPEHVDIVIGGGGQDSGQVRVAHDLQRHRKALNRLAVEGTPMLMICGMYQLFGHEFTTAGGERLPGIGVLDVTTTGSDVRMIGNVVVSSNDFGEIIGYENHSGDTVVGSASSPLGTVIVGAGNNPRDKSEGARSHNVIGSYLHGSVLPKNPELCDFLVATAAINRYGSVTRPQTDNAVVNRARAQSKSRPR